ncbi:MAG: hypothetical protein AAF982_11490 [Pseudomonadota bacterium]
MPIAARLGSTAYFVPSIDGGEYRSVPELCAGLRAMDAARKFMRQKGKETIQEADILDELHCATRTLQPEDVEDASILWAGKAKGPRQSGDRQLLR